RDGGEERGLDLGRVIDAWRHAVRQQVQQEGFLAGRRVLDQLDQFSRLLRGQRQRWDAERVTFGSVLTIGLQHLLASVGCDGDEVIGEEGGVESIVPRSSLLHQGNLIERRLRYGCFGQHCRSSFVTRSSKDVCNQRLNPDAVVMTLTRNKNE